MTKTDLRKVFDENGFGNTKTYLNSGNVLFFSDIEDAKALTKKIESMIHESFGIDIPLTACKL